MTNHDEVEFSNKLQIPFFYYVTYLLLLPSENDELKCSTEIIYWKFLIIIIHIYICIVFIGYALNSLFSHPWCHLHIITKIQLLLSLSFVPHCCPSDANK